jgi:hypothetical protein
MATEAQPEVNRRILFNKTFHSCACSLTRLISYYAKSRVEFVPLVIIHSKLCKETP